MFATIVKVLNAILAQLVIIAQNTAPADNSEEEAQG